jgi:hypothetical protein
VWLPNAGVRQAVNSANTRRSAKQAFDPRSRM